MIYYIYNPLSKNKTGINIFKKRHINNLYDCTNVTDMKDLESKLSDKDTLYIIGGDGTLHFLFNQYNFLTNYTIKFIKNGSGNDFYRSLNSNKSYCYSINEKIFL